MTTGENVTVNARDSVSNPNDETSPRRKRVKARTGPDGVHLFDRATGLNVLFDEIRVAEDSWSRAPRQVSIALTNSCDLACGYCYAPKQRAALEVGDVMGWARELDAEGCLGVGFGGGPRCIGSCRTYAGASPERRRSP